MPEPSPSSLIPFAWIQKRDGRVVPFEADKISRALFAAGESLGQPDAFMARELTDSVLHFLVAEETAATPTTVQVAELVAKVVRELGHPALANVYTAHSEHKASVRSGAKTAGEQPDRLMASNLPGRTSLPHRCGPTEAELARWVGEVPPAGSLAWKVAGHCLTEFSTRRLFTRDLIAAQADGLLTLTGLASPLELAGTVMSLADIRSNGLIEAMERERNVAGSWVILDSPEYLVVRDGLRPEQAYEMVRSLVIGARLSHLRPIVNLNVIQPPGWAADLAVGPLFAQHRQPHSRGDLRQAIDLLLDPLLIASERELHINWHLGPSDFQEQPVPRLLRVARRAMEGAQVTFVFDRPGLPIRLAEGFDREHPAILLLAGLHLPALVRQLEEETDTARFLEKLRSLARLALSAATQKREFLRRHSSGRPALHRGFLLDRARLVVVPVGLQAVTHAMLGQGIAESEAARHFACDVLNRLSTVLKQDGQSCSLDACLDSLPPECPLDHVYSDWRHLLQLPFPEPEMTDNRGPAVRETVTAPGDQARLAGILQQGTKTGTAALAISPVYPLSAETAAELVRFAWEETDVVALRFVRQTRPQHQHTASWIASQE